MFTTDYGMLAEQLRALTDAVPYLVTNLANAAALIFERIEGINWAGFYVLHGDTLVLAPFQGKTACTTIAHGKGVCGAAVVTGKTQRVEDVHKFAGHIACDSASRSEIVLPLRVSGEIFGVLDIDSPLPARFSPEDQAGFELIAEIIEDIIERCGDALL